MIHSLEEEVGLSVGGIALADGCFEGQSYIPAEVESWENSLCDNAIPTITSYGGHVHRCVHFTSTWIAV